MEVVQRNNTYEPSSWESFYNKQEYLENLVCGNHKYYLKIKKYFLLYKLQNCIL